jgi:hypothetical protein
MKRLIPILILLLLNNACEPPPAPKPAPQNNSIKPDSPSEPTTSSTSLLDEESMRDRIDKFSLIPPEDDSVITIGNYTTPKPETWIWTPQKTQAVNVNYLVPNIKEDDQALFSATMFNKDEAGNFAHYLERAKSMFRTNDGAPVKPTILVIPCNGRNAVLAEFNGEYMGSGAAWHLKNHALLVVEVQEPDCKMYIKILGSKETVNAHREAFIETVSKLQPNN